MCVNIAIDGKEIGCQRELAAAMPKGFVIVDDYPPNGLPEGVAPGQVVTSSDSEYCLCPVDVPKTAELNGFDCEQEDDGFGWLFARKEADG